MKKGVIILVLAFCNVVVMGQGLFETSQSATTGTSDFTLKGYARGSLYGWGKKFDYTNGFGELSIQAKLKKEKFVMNSDIRFRSGYLFNEQRSETEIKEAYAGISTSTVDLLLGEQIISWGRTDGFNPTNNITPNNYFFFSAEPDDQKMSNLLLKADIRITKTINWEIIAIPVYRPSKYRYDLFDMGTNVSLVDPLFPERSFKNSTLATKLNFEYSGIGFSASWFHGYDPFYGFDLKNIDFSTGSPVITYIPSFYRKNSIGIDFAIPAGCWIFRGEGAYNLTENEENKIFIPNKDLSYVVGLEHNFGGVTTIIQYIGKYTQEFKELAQPVLTDPMNPIAQLTYAGEMIGYESASMNRKIFHQGKETDHAVSVSITRDFAYETVNGELTGYYDFTTREYLIRPKVSWKIGGGLNASAGCNLMNGPDKSIFSYASPVMNGAFIELKANF